MRRWHRYPAIYVRHRIPHVQIPVTGGVLTVAALFCCGTHLETKIAISGLLQERTQQLVAVVSQIRESCCCNVRDIASQSALEEFAIDGWRVGFRRVRFADEWMQAVASL